MKYYHSLSVSLIAHLLIAVVVYYQLTTINTVKYGNDERQILSSYLVNTPAVIATAKQQTATPVVPHAIALHTQQKTQQNQPKQTASVRTRAALKGAPMPELIALLHTAIQKAQRYPASAQEMEREGRTTVGFTLYQNGTISDLAILRSSGTNSLDSAALAAVNDAAPFPQVDRYLPAAQTYQIDVVFALS